MSDRKERIISICLMISMVISLLSVGAPVYAATGDETGTPEIAIAIAPSVATPTDANDNNDVSSDQDTEAEKEAVQILSQEGVAPIAETPVEEPVSVTYYVHQQTYGNSSSVKDGTTAGTIGSGKRMEAFAITKIELPAGINGSVEYHAHCQSVGWQSWVSVGKMAGTTGQKKRLEALQMRLTGDLSKQYDIYYRTYMSNYGWLDWTKNGGTSGTVGFAAVIEGVQIKVVKKGSEDAPRTGNVAALTTDNVNTISYSGHVQTYGDLPAVPGGAILGTTGQKKRMEALKINMSHQNGQLFGQIKYSVHCQTYGWMPEVTEGTLAGTTGQKKRMEAVSINLSGDIAKYCDIYYRVHVQSFGWMGWAKNGEYAGTSGNSYRIEAIQIQILPKGSAAPGSTNFAYTALRYDDTTTGNQILQPYLDEILAKCTNDSMTKEQKLRAVYDYVVHNYTYKSLSADHPANFTWDQYYAYTIVTTGQGNCYAYASLFCQLARKIGYPQAVVKRGSMGRNRAPHGWCEIDGVLYDPEIEYKHPNVPRFGFTDKSNPYSYYYE